MIDYRILVPAFLYGIAFDSMGAAPFGFYFVPLMLAASLFGAFLFAIRVMNLAVSWAFGALLMFLLAVLINGGALPSSRMLIHLTAYLSPFLAVAAVFYAPER